MEARHLDTYPDELVVEVLAVLAREMDEHFCERQLEERSATPSKATRPNRDREVRLDNELCDEALGVFEQTEQQL
jgi:hypothetical protein